MNRSPSPPRRPLAGLLLLHKDVGVSSNQALQRVRHLYRAAKAGHGGTLDPFASGLLPILFGDATKFGDRLLAADKRYRVLIRFGQETDSQDSSGTPSRTAPLPHWDAVDWPALLARFTGPIRQTPPAYSALKVAGRRAYERARAGETVALEPRTVTIHELRRLDHGADSLTLEVHCSKGTYIRTLAEDIGRALNSAAHAERLERLAVGPFRTVHLTDAALRSLSPAARDSLILPLDYCLAGVERFDVPPAKQRYIRNGNDIAVAPAPSPREVALYADGRFFGLGWWEGARLYPRKLCALPTGESP